MNRRIYAALAAFILPLAVVACGDDGNEPASSGADAASTERSAEFPVTVRDVTLDAAPERIVSLTPTATETLFAIGAGDRVVAADKNSNHPAEVPNTDLSGFEPNIEAIAGYEPDLVIASNDTDGLVAALDDLDIPVLLLPAAVDIDDVYSQIIDMGAATGHPEEAAEVVDQVKGEIEAVVDEVGDAGKGLTYYYELDPTFYSVTSATFIGQVLALLGLENIADAAQAKASDYPQLSAEYIVDQDPDLILLADTKCCDQDAEAVAGRDGWAGMKAVTGNGVVELDDDIASRWGPRVPELLAAVAAGIEKVAG